MRKPKIVGHRGMPSRYPENTIPSFLAALKTGVDAVEFDVRLTADDQMVITHDETLDRCSNGHGDVRNFTFAELRRLDFGSWKSSEFAGLQIPAFSEVLDVICEHSATMEILIELKETDESCALRVLDEVRRRHLLNRVSVLSAYADVLKMLHETDPLLRIQGFRAEDFLHPVPDVYEFLHRLCLWRGAVDASLVNQFHQLGIEVDICPVDTEEQLLEVLSLDADTLTTNAADVIVPLLAPLMQRNDG